MTVRGIYKDDALLTGGIITQTLLQRLTQINGVQIVLATLEPGSDPEEVAKLATTASRRSSRRPSCSRTPSSSSRSATRSTSCSS